MDNRVASSMGTDGQGVVDPPVRRPENGIRIAFARDEAIVNARREPTDDFDRVLWRLSSRYQVNLHSCPPGADQRF